MEKQKRVSTKLITAVLLVVLSSCGKPTREQTGSIVLPFASFCDIPGVTDDEIKAIETLQSQNITLIYGTPATTEAFIKDDGEIGGFIPLFCGWLTELLGIEVKTGIYEWGDMLRKISTGEIAFCGLLPTEERLATYYMTDPISERSLSVMRITGSRPLGEIAMSRPVRYVFLEDSAFIGMLAGILAPGSYEYITADNYDDVYRLLNEGKENDGSPEGADAFIEVNIAEVAFDKYGDVHSEDFMPLIFSDLSMATEQAALEPVITVVTKALKNGSIHHLNELYKIGYTEYQQNKFFMMLDEDERAYMQDTSVVKVLAENWFYPLNYYNRYEKQWEGIAFDVLEEVARLTGISFEVANDPDMAWAEMFEMLENGEVPISLDLIYTEERANNYLWSKYPYLSETYALLSKHDFPNISIGEIQYARIGLIKSTGYAAMFQVWFPNAVNVTVYDSQDETFLALDRDEVDLIMAGTNALSSVTNYYELSSYKANYIFNSTIDYVLVFNKQEALLHSVVDKALSLVNINAISKRWESKTFDYQSKLLREQRPWLIGISVLSLVVLALVSFLLVISRSAGKRLEKLVSLRTGELEYRTSMLQTMVDSIPDIVYCKDLKLNLTLCNKFFASYLGCEKEQLIGAGNNPNGTLPDDVVENANAIDKKIIDEGKTIVFEQIIPSFKGEKRLFETIKAPLIQESGVTGIVGIARDITQRKVMEEEALAASRSKSAFLANMSHEMRTPMNVVVGLTDLMLEDEDPSASLTENLKKISTAGNTLLNLINDVLDISKIEAGKLELTPVKYDVPSLLNDIITLNIIRIEEKPISFVLDISDEIPCYLYGDDLRVKQIVNNLLSNAFKYTQKGNVTLGMNCEPDGDGHMRMSVYVSDTGIGIQEGDMKKLFADYNQVDAQANRKIEGTGLGLSITRRLAEMMDGEVSVESEYGKGSVFRLRISQGYVSDERIGRETAENLRSFQYMDKRKRAYEKLKRSDLSYASVLVVDDMQTNLDVAAGMLKKYKMRVDCVTSGQEAIDRISAKEPMYDAVFMDHMMPVMDGVEATEKIRGIGTKYAMTIPIIALTANAIAGNEQMFLNKDFQAFLPKPINIMKLDSIVQRWVRDKARE